VGFVTLRALDPILTRLSESAPQFMGVPLPLVLGALAVAVIVHARRFLRFRTG
jgi:hypothetical protein